MYHVCREVYAIFSTLTCVGHVSLSRTLNQFSGASPEWRGREKNTLRRADSCPAEKSGCKGKTDAFRRAIEGVASALASKTRNFCEEKHGWLCEIMAISSTSLCTAL